MSLYAIVQHSAAGYAGDLQFIRALETREVTEAQARDIVARGGVVMPGYLEAEEYAEAEMYPPEVTGLIPNVRGSFLRKKVDGLHLYAPVTQPEGALRFGVSV